MSVRRRAHRCAGCGLQYMMRSMAGNSSLLRGCALAGSQSLTMSHHTPYNVYNFTRYDATEYTASFRFRFRDSDSCDSAAVCSSAGGPCLAAGTLVVCDGDLRELYPHSGHYRPGEHNLHQLLVHLRSCGVNLAGFTVDVQRLYKARHPEASPGLCSTSDRRARLRRLCRWRERRATAPRSTRR